MKGQQIRKQLILMIMIVIILILIVAAILLIKGKSRSDSTPRSDSDYVGPAVTDVEAADSSENQTIQVDNLVCQKENSKTISLSWDDTFDDCVSKYLVKRRSLLDKNEKWEDIETVRSNGIAGDEEYSVKDNLQSTEPQQYLYRVDIETTNANVKTENGKPIVASNISVCIDPGHYLHSSTLSGNNLYGYDEGGFMLTVGKQLRDILEKQYGISCVMTRDSDNISLNGYSNGDVDNVRISIRGEVAQGTDLFISLHTNANLDDANGYPTGNQPITINKTLVFVNQIAAKSPVQLKQANAIGINVTEANYKKDLSFTKKFDTAEGDHLKEWSDEFNDSLNTCGTICYRIGDNGNDYYGVLRGSNNVGVPGFIVEHGFHTVEEVRKACMNEDLGLLWAQADAAGIAAGYGFSPITA